MRLSGSRLNLGPQLLSTSVRFLVCPLVDGVVEHLCGPWWAGYLVYLMNISLSCFKIVENAGFLEAKHCYLGPSAEHQVVIILMLLPLENGAGNHNQLLC